MERSTDRVIDGYSEKHHIVPKCMGGDNKPRNIAVLTPEEHYLAHQLLVKIYPGNSSLIYAASMMCVKRGGNKRHGWIKRKLASDLSKRSMGNQYSKGRVLSEATKKKISDSHKGKKVSQATKKKISDATKGSNNQFYGKTHSEQTRIKISESQIGRICSEETRKKLSIKSSGSNNPAARGVRQYDLQGNFIKDWSTGREAAISINHKDGSVICARCRLRDYRICGGYLWRYVEDGISSLVLTK